MINIKITDHGIHMSGHACMNGTDGVDRVCAAVSALTCNLINSLKDLSNDRIRADTGSGMTIIEYSQAGTDSECRAEMLSRARRWLANTGLLYRGWSKKYDA